ncbi:membrane protein [Caballeronia mineralivorans PML1(12)]|uniref:Membrane protein n=1 Tax=Caballeronia mineralivorans PML1(12) TaxID=908627 RepID=A0A0J1CNT9_9BURK|nr:bifunctional DedA family/phosphatase PAP2 family protein [Caballeronia mineralivorans]KLU22390.1 membrane protein [Caballeronia mineralivorans PML1(12)]
MHAWLASIGAHPYLVLAVVFGVACAESLAVIGTFIPAGIVMFAAGALIGAGALNGWVTLAIGALGAVAGDGISYELGHRYHREVRMWWRAKGHEAVWERGERFVQRHGGKSIVLARFFAPVRAIVPLVVGASHMPRRRFYPINIASALAWSPAHIGPGIVFGASAQLAEAVSGRLAAMLLMLAGLAWLLVRLVHVAVQRGIPLAKRAFTLTVQWLGRRSPRLAGRLLRIVDPARPEFQTLGVLVLLFIGSIWMFLGILQDVVARDPLVRADTALYSFLQALRTVPTDRLMAGMVELGGYGAGLFVAGSVLIWLLVRRRWRSAAWWILVVGVAAALTPVIEPGASYIRPLNWRPGTAHSPLPSGHATFTLLVYGFLGWLLIQRQTPLWRNTVIAVISIWIMMTGLARLYVGEDWLAGVLGGWSLGVAWFAVLAGAYAYRQVRDDILPGVLACIAGGALAIFGSWTISEHLETDLARYSVVTHETVLTPRQWTEGEWRALPGRRSEISGDEEENFPLQWAESDGAITHRLEATGWQAAPAWSIRPTLLWLSPQTSVDALPVLPLLAAGKGSELTFVKFDPQRPMGRLVLRLWRSPYRLTTGTQTDEPIWYGALYQEAFRQPWHLVTLGTTTSWPEAIVVPQLLPIGMHLLSRSTMQDGAVRRVVLVLPLTSEESPQ